MNYADRQANPQYALSESRTMPNCGPRGLRIDTRAISRAAIVALFSLLITACSGGSGSSSAQPGVQPESIASAESEPSIYREAIPRVEAYLLDTGFTGAVLIAHQDEVLLSEGYGLADKEAALPNTPHTRFRIASNTKAFTAAAVLLLQQRGQLDVRDNACKYLADCPAGWENITLHQLLVHTSGIPNYHLILEVFLDHWNNPHTVLERVADISGYPLDFDPGTGWSYNNSAYVVLGLIIENVSGTSYEAFLRDDILVPLGLTASGVLAANDDGAFATGYIGETPVDFQETGLHADGAMYATIGDLYLWDQSLYGDLLLRDEQRDLMFGHHSEVGAFFETLYTEGLPPEMGYGYGWFLARSFGRETHTHFGSIYGFRSRIIRVPAEQLIIILLSNDHYLDPWREGEMIMGQLFSGTGD